jgi:hypothetical protein
MYHSQDTDKYNINKYYAWNNSNILSYDSYKLLQIRRPYTLYSNNFFDVTWKEKLNKLIDIIVGFKYIHYANIIHMEIFLFLILSQKQ